MTEIERYEFDRTGYVVIPEMLTPQETDDLAKAIDGLEVHALAHLDQPPRKKSAWGAEYHRNEELGYHTQGSNEDGKTLMVEDFWNSNRTFDVLVNHERTMEYVQSVIQERPTINNSESHVRRKCVC